MAAIARGREDLLQVPRPLLRYVSTPDVTPAPGRPAWSSSTAAEAEQGLRDLHDMSSGQPRESAPVREEEEQRRHQAAASGRGTAGCGRG